MTPLPENVTTLKDLVSHCTLCPRNCGVDRTAGRTGACHIGETAVVASAGPHRGEEPMLVGRGGSGTIFFSGCNLDCVFCQNDDISHTTEGHLTEPDRIARLALDLQARGCENVNFVTPTHVAHAVAEAVFLARRDGLTVPVVYNCGGYESVETLRLLAGLIEIYMPDFKWASAAAGKKYSGVENYPAVAEAALAEMYRQVGPLELDEREVATRGVLVRHLVMPGNLADSEQVIETVARGAPGCTINVMAQYRPCYRADEFPELCSRPDVSDIVRLQRLATDLGLVLAR